jgi:hypothetical protein
LEPQRLPPKGVSLFSILIRGLRLLKFGELAIYQLQGPNWLTERPKDKTATLIRSPPSKKSKPEHLMGHDDESSSNPRPAGLRRTVKPPELFVSGPRGVGWWSSWRAGNWRVLSSGRTRCRRSGRGSAIHRIIRVRDKNMRLSRRGAGGIEG